MNKFSEAYAAGKAALDSGDLAGDFKTMQPTLKTLLTPAGGPDAAAAEQLSKLRTCINNAAKPLVTKGAAQRRAEAQAIIAGAGDGAKLVDRAATLKMLRHLYHEKTAGGQAIWVYSPPKVYTKWIHDEVSGASATVLEDRLAKDPEEVYTETQRGIMATAVQTARSVAQAVVVKLDAASDDTKTIVRRYFGNAASSADDIKNVIKTLCGGYKRIAAAANDSSIIISDEPGDRTGGGWKDWAFVYHAETMSVIYLQGAWLAKADEITPSNQPPLYRCTRTVIHELSHKVVNTEDIVYGPKGLKVEGSSALTPEYALHNADSWAYFAMDLLGHLTGTDKTNGDTSCSEIRKTPERTLTTA